MSSNYQPDLFLSSVPKRPYCSDELGEGLKIRSREAALRHRYMQHNPPHQLAFLVFDFDRAGAMVAANDCGLPEPSWVTENRETRRGHLAYALACPVITSDAARAAPLRYAASVEQGYRDALRADPGYAGLITKTPDHEAWATRWGRGPYTLEELADYLPTLPTVRAKRAEASGLGRNVSLFEGLRKWAYRARVRFDDADEWHEAVRCHALGINGGFSNPLPANEVKATAKSVAGWVWQRFNAAKFSEIQGARARLRAGHARMARLQQALELDR
jgi:Replicase family/Primase C terminal 1 (PriCT-1)